MGARLRADLPKALVPLCGTPILVHTLRRIARISPGAVPVVLVPPEHHAAFARVCATYETPCRLLHGGAERQDSVRAGLEALPSDTGIVAIHDAARCLIRPEPVLAAVAAAEACGAATVAVPVVDTILVADAEEYLESTPDRRTLWACQTPQVFQYEVIMAAHRSARAEGFLGTDDASLVRRAGGRVKLVAGDSSNIKITRPADLRMAEALLAEEDSCTG
ncbi:MAG: 2-C-methyl-D-erythritol 4-phosphate cytidylyltransferase [Candidatus Hydrogenedens sp.]|nr:2-C-methyl-D-erythritol 4-phosphate cytidylyltransferase [Candidatus Hydrogenedens sp.]